VYDDNGVPEDGSETRVRKENNTHHHRSRDAAHKKASRERYRRSRGGTTTLRFPRGPGQTRRRPVSAGSGGGGGLASAERVAAMGFRRTFGTDTNAEAPVRPQNG